MWFFPSFCRIELSRPHTQALLTPNNLATCTDPRNGSRSTTVHTPCYKVERGLAERERRGLEEVAAKAQAVHTRTCTHMHSAHTHTHTHAPFEQVACSGQGAESRLIKQHEVTPECSP